MIAVFLAEGFEEIEALCPTDLLRRAGKEVKLIGVETMEVTGSHQIRVQADLSASDLPFEDLEAVILPGGLPGTLNLESSPVVQKVIDYCVEKGVLIAAICAAPSILGHKGLLKGKSVTSAPAFQKELTGGTLSAEYVVLDGTILTARGMGVSTQFGLKLVELLVSKEKAAELEESIQWKK